MITTTKMKQGFSPVIMVQYLFQALSFVYFEIFHNSSFFNFFLYLNLTKKMIFKAMIISYTIFFVK